MPLILVYLRLDGVSQVLPKSVASVFVAAISRENFHAPKFANERRLPYPRDFHTSLPYGATTLGQIEIPRTNESSLLGVCKWWRGQSSSSQRHILDLQLKQHVQGPDQGQEFTLSSALSARPCLHLFLVQWGRQSLCMHVLLWSLLLSIVMRLGFLQR